MRFVMQPMKYIKEKPMMHQTMRPVKIGIMQYYGDDQAEHAVKPTQIRHLRVNQCPALRHEHENAKSVQRKDHRRQDRITYFASNRRWAYRPWLNFTPLEGITLPSIKNKEYRAGRDYDQQKLAAKNHRPSRQRCDEISEIHHASPSVLCLGLSAAGTTARSIWAKIFGDP